MTRADVIAGLLTGDYVAVASFIAALVILIWLMVTEQTRRRRS